jgi:hypothetical protein
MRVENAPWDRAVRERQLVAHPVDTVTCMSDYSECSDLRLD